MKRNRTERITRNSNNNFIIFNTITYYCAVVIATIIIGAVINVSFQSKKYFEVIEKNANIAVFVDFENKISKELMFEEIINLDGVSSAEYISQDKVFETAIKESPELKELLMYGESPFSPFFVVRLQYISLSSVEKLRYSLLEIKGVEDVRYDSNVFVVAENLKGFIKFYEWIIRFILIAAIIIIIVKIVVSLYERFINYRHYLNLAAGGICSGLAGFGAYYFLSNKLFVLPSIYFPTDSFVSFLIAGVLITLVWD